MDKIICINCGDILTDKNWYEKYKEKHWRRCIDCAKQINSIRYHKNKISISKQKSLRAKSNRLICLQHYSETTTPFCICCGEKTIVFLTLDHPNNDGNIQRKKLCGSGTAFYRWLIKNNFPVKLEVRCWNCNLAKAINGKCPHELIKLRIRLK